MEAKLLPSSLSPPKPSSFLSLKKQQHQLSFHLRPSTALHAAGPISTTTTTTNSNGGESNNNNNEDNELKSQPPPRTISIRYKSRSKKARQLKLEQEGAAATRTRTAPPPKKWEDMTVAEKAVELYVGEKGLLFWLNKFAYASIFIVIGGWILFRFVGPSLGLYQLDAPPLSPTEILKGSP